MRSSRARALLVVLGVALPGALGCEAILGLDGYTKVDGSADAGQDVLGYVDAPQDAVDETPVYNPDASAASRWARWIMPNAPGDAGDGGVPNPATYVVAQTSVTDAGSTGDAGDAGGTVETVLDTTAFDAGGPRHVWVRDVVSKNSILEAEAYCTSLGFRLPTRIELVSILDASRATEPLVDPIFVGPTGMSPSGPHWTQSPTPTKTQVWTVDFRTGEVQPAALTGAKLVRCIR